MRLTLMPGLHSCLGYSLKLFAKCEEEVVRTNVDIHTLVWELRDEVECSLNNESRHLCPLTQVWFSDIFLRAMRRDENRLRVWKIKRMYPSHSCSRFISWCLDENGNRALHVINSFFKPIMLVLRERPGGSYILRYSCFWKKKIINIIKFYVKHQHFYSALLELEWQ